MSRNRNASGRSHKTLNHRFPSLMWGITPHCGGSQSASLIRSSAGESAALKGVTLSLKGPIQCNLRVSYGCKSDNLADLTVQGFPGVLAHKTERQRPQRFIRVLHVKTKNRRREWPQIHATPTNTYRTIE